LAGVVGGMAFITEPSMAATMGPIVFVVVVVGGLGSLSGAFAASLIIGLLQTVPLTVDASLAGVAAHLGWTVEPAGQGRTLATLTLAQAAPVLPYLLLVVMLIVRPKGLRGRREA
jgi:branched-chain amino acid transport system permease protein